jgi:hypothetical protein
VAVVDGVGDQRLRVVARADAVDREAQPDRPAVGALEETLARRIVVERRDVVARGQQRAHLVEREAQLALAELGELAVRAQTRQRRERRIGAAREHDAPVRRQALEQQVEEFEHGRVADAVRIVDDDQAALDVARGEHVEQLRGDRMAVAAAAAGLRDQRLGVDPPRRIERLERGDQAGEEAERIVVDVGRDPRHRGAAFELLDQSRQRRGLAEAGRCGDRGRDGGRAPRSSSRLRAARGRRGWRGRAAAGSWSVRSSA